MEQVQQINQNTFMYADRVLEQITSVKNLLLYVSLYIKKMSVIGLFSEVQQQEAVWLQFSGCELRWMTCPLKPSTLHFNVI